MKKLLLASLFLSLAAPLLGQMYDPSVPLSISHNEQVVGKNNLTQSDIVATSYSFPDRMLDYTIDPGRGVLNVLLTGTNISEEKITYLVAYDMRDNKKLWDRDAVNTERLLGSGDLLMSVESNRSVLRNPTKGKQTWKTSDIIFHVDSTTQRGIALYFGAGNSCVESIDLKTGNSLWTKDLSFSQGWAGYSWINDSLLCVKASGLNVININTGNGWTFETPIGTRPYNSSTTIGFYIMFGVVGALLTLPYAMSDAFADMSIGLCSDILVDDDNIYFAGREKVVCLSMSGETKWHNDLQKEMTSASQLLLDNGVLYVINKGYGFDYGKQKSIGVSSVAAFRTSDGAAIFEKQIGEKKGKKLIKDPIAAGENIYLIYDKTVAKVSHVTSEVVQEKTFADSISHFLKGDVFLRSSGSENSTGGGADFTPLSTLSALGNIYVAKTDGNVVGLAPDLTEINPKGFGDEFVRYYKGKSYSFLASGSNTVVIDSQNHEVANFEASRKAKVVGNFLYDQHGSTISAIDVSAFIEP